VAFGVKVSEKLHNSSGTKVDQGYRREPDLRLEGRRYPRTQHGVNQSIGMSAGHFLQGRGRIDLPRHPIQGGGTGNPFKLPPRPGTTQERETEDIR